MMKIQTIAPVCGVDFGWSSGDLSLVKKWDGGGLLI